MEENIVLGAPYVEDKPTKSRKIRIFLYKWLLLHGSMSLCGRDRFSFMLEKEARKKGHRSLGIKQVRANIYVWCVFSVCV